jgi:hypothetical protein
VGPIAGFHGSASEILLAERAEEQLFSNGSLALRLNSANDDTRWVAS